MGRLNKQWDTNNQRLYGKIEGMDRSGDESGESGGEGEEEEEI